MAMPKQDAILAKIIAEKKQAPVGAFAVELDSNLDVEGNLNSKHMYNQTKDENNGLVKGASGIKYLEKIATKVGLGNSAKNWGKRLIGNIKDAEPLTQLGLGAGAIVGAGKLKNMVDEARTKAERESIEERSLRALHGINRTLSSAVIKPSNG